MNAIPKSNPPITLESLKARAADGQLNQFEADHVEYCYRNWYHHCPRCSMVVAHPSMCDKCRDESREELEKHMLGLVDASVTAGHQLRLASAANRRKRNHLKRLQSQKKCWWCRLKRFVRQNFGSWMGK